MNFSRPSRLCYSLIGQFSFRFEPSSTLHTLCPAWGAFAKEFLYADKIIRKLFSFLLTGGHLHCLPIRHLLMVGVYAKFAKYDHSLLSNKLSKDKQAKLNALLLSSECTKGNKSFNILLLFFSMIWLNLKLYNLIQRKIVTIFHFCLSYFVTSNTPVIRTGRN